MKTYIDSMHQKQFCHFCIARLLASVVQRSQSSLEMMMNEDDDDDEWNVKDKPFHPPIFILLSVSPPNSHLILPPSSPLSPPPSPLPSPPPPGSLHPLPSSLRPLAVEHLSSEKHLLHPTLPSSIIPSSLFLT